MKNFKIYEKIMNKNETFTATCSPLWKPTGNAVATYVLSGRIAVHKPDRETTYYEASKKRIGGGFFLPSRMFTVEALEDNTLYRCFSHNFVIGDFTMYTILELELAANQETTLNGVVGIATITGNVSINNEVLVENVSRDFDEATLTVKANVDSVVAYAIKRV